jgi:hypothetical protein
MKTKLFRITSTLAALLLALGIVFGLSYAGDKSKGPIDNFFNYTGEVVTKVEKDIIVEKREVKRSDKLKWFEAYKNNIALLKKPSKMLLGAYDNDTKESFESIINLEDSLHTTLPLIQIYTAWGGKEEESFPVKQVKAILELGSLPVITWEPWLTAFDEENYPNLPSMDKRDKHGMADVAQGKYDFYLKKWADDAKKIEKPIFLRMGHEMNDPYRYPWGPQNNSAAEFVAGWKHVHDIFKQEGTNNIVWVWSPHPAYGFFKEFYPGDAYVDYVGAGVLNYGTVASWSKWWSFDEIFGKYYPQLSAFNKPIMISEFGSLAVGGKRGEWFANAMDSLPQKYPAIKSILFFHFSEDKTTTQQVLNWYIKDDTAVTKVIARKIKGW